MSKIDLKQQYIDFIKTNIEKILPNTQIFIFGSRTQGQALEYSDVDIALKSNDQISLDKLLKIKAFFKDSTFPYKVDIVDLNNVDESFLGIIASDLYKIN